MGPHATPVTEMDLTNAKLWPDVLQETSESIAETLKQAKTAYSEDPDGFVNKNYGVLGRAISAYSKLFTRTECSSREDLENRWSKHFASPAVRDAVEDLVSVEEEWNNFLASVDDISHVISTNSKLEKGSSIKDLSIELTNVNNEEEKLLSDLTNDHLSLFILLRHFA